MKIKFLGEFFGTAALLMIVVGSGIMGESLASGNAALALLLNALSTGLGLFLLIALLGPVSGAHFNPAVSLWAFLQKSLSFRGFWLYSFAQFAGAAAGVIAAHAMYDLDLLQKSSRIRSSPGLAISEFLAAFGLIAILRLTPENERSKLPARVAIYITSAYLFTSSTSFANPAATLARALTQTFSGISLESVPLFICAQLLGVWVCHLGLRR